MKGIVQALVWVLALALVTVLVAYLMARPITAAACPACFGLEKAADGVYVQTGMGAAERSRVLATVTASRAQAGKFYGGLQHQPRILVCADDACFGRMGGMPGAATGAQGSDVLMVSHLGSQQGGVFITAGLSRAELYGRVGFWKFNMGAVPMWFDEGVAVEVAEDPMYLAPRPIGGRCKAGSFPDMPATPSEWQQELQTEGDVLYAQSACKVDMWIFQNGGPKAVTGLLAKVAQGQDFDKLFPPQ